MSKPTVLFDFDGVISDSFSVGFSALNQLCPHIPEQAYRDAHEGNINEWHWRNFSDTHSDACRHDLQFNDVYPQLFKTRAQPFPHMVDIVRTLAAKHPLFIVSSTQRTNIIPFLEQNGIADAFTDVLGFEANLRKDAKIASILKDHGLAPTDAVFITDTLGDIREATSVLVDSIGVTWGYHTREQLLQGEPWRIIELPQEIPNAVSEFFHGKGTAA